MYRREIEPDQAEKLGEQLIETFNKNGNNRVGQTNAFAASMVAGPGLLRYSPDELLGNPIIRKKLIEGYRAIKFHKGKEGSDVEVEARIRSELQEIFIRTLEFTDF